MALVPKIDIDQTLENVTRFLDGHKMRVLRAGKSLNTLQSTSLDGMPKTPSYKNIADNRIIERANAAYEVEETYIAVNRLDIKSQTIIKRLWLDRDTKQNWQVSHELNYGSTRYGELKRKALVAFAEAYMARDLRAFENRQLSGN